MIRQRRVLALGLTAVLAVSACGSSATPTPTQAPPTAPGATPTPAPSPTPVTATITVGFPSPADNTHVPTFLAIDDLNAAGWHVTPTFFSGPEVDAAALAAGQIQFMVNASIPDFSAIQAGGKMHIIGKEQGTAWAVVVANDITSCDGLVGKRWALNSPGGSTTSYANYWIKTNCSADSQSKIQPIYISGSQNREAAMVAGQLDGSLLGPEDIVNLNQAAPGKFHVLADFASDPSMGGFVASTFVVNDDYATAHPEVVVAFLQALLKAYSDASKDVSVLVKPAQ